MLILELSEPESEALSDLIRREVDRLDFLDDDRMWIGTIETSEILKKLLKQLACEPSNGRTL
jgi:hypothetical protein